MQVYHLRQLFKFCRTLLPVYIKSKFKPTPIWMHLYITRKCNLNCKYCFARDPLKPDLDEEQLKKIIDQLYYLGCRFISFYGGEPTIKKFFIDIVKYANQKGMMTHMSTNGVLLKPDYINRLIDAGIDVINLSIDSVFEFNDSKKDYTKSKDVLNNLIEKRKKFPFEINVNLVITNKNINNVIPTIKLIHNFRIAISLGLIVKNTYNNLPQDKSLFFNSRKDKIKLYKVLNEIKKFKKSGYGIIEPLQYFDDIKKFVEGKLDWYCCSGKHSFSVDSDGKFQICVGLPAENISIFDVKRDYYKKFSDIREKRQSRCKKICLSNCSYHNSYFIKHPFSSLKEIFSIVLNYFRFSGSIKDPALKKLSRR